MNVLVIGRGGCNIKRLIVCSDVDVVCSHKIYLLWDYLPLLSSLKIKFC